MATDVYMSSGDLKLGGHGDLKLADSEEDVLQSIKFRLQTVIGDYLLQPGCGSSLELLIGEPNTRQTGTMAENLVNNALVNDGFLSSADCKVQAAYVNDNAIAILVRVELPYERVVLSSHVLDLREGVVQAR